MNLTIKSRDGLQILQKIYEGYENTNTKKDWQINTVNEEGVFTEVAVNFDMGSLLNREENGLIKMMAIEILRIKQKQHLKKYNIDIDNIYECEDDDTFIENEALAVALDTAESAYFVSLITILLLEHLRQGKESIDLSAFARFNLRDFNEDFDARVNELKELKKEIESGDFSFESIAGEDWDGSIVGSPLEIFKALRESMITKEDDQSIQEADLTLMGNKDGSFEVYNGEKTMNIDEIEELLGFSFEVMDDDTDYGLEFENSMIIVLYSLVFLKTKIIYVDDRYNKNLKQDIVSYLENAGAYPEYSPFIIDKK